MRIRLRGVWPRGVWIGIAAALAGLALVTALVGIWVAQSDWLRERVRTMILEQASAATGGTVEIGSFDFDWRGLEARLKRFVIHGNEPPSSSPLLQIDQVTARFTIISLLRRSFHIDALDVGRLQTHLIVNPDGSTNVPRPKRRSKANGLETILDLKIGEFKVADGGFLVELPGKQPTISPWSVDGRNLSAKVGYDAANVRYAGALAVAPLRLFGTDLEISGEGSINRTNATIARFSAVSVPDGRYKLILQNGRVENFAHPVYTTRFEAGVDLASAAGLAKLNKRLFGRLDLTGDARFVSVDEFTVTGTAQSADCGFDKVRNALVKASFEATPHDLVIRDFRIDAFGGRVAGKAAVRDYNLIRASGRLDHFDLRQTAKIETQRALPYDGLVSGLFELSGNLKNFKPDLNAQLDISPAAQGPAARGRISVRYSVARSTVELGQSWIELPGTRLDLSGTLGGKLSVKAASHDVNDVLPVLDMLTQNKPPPVSYASVGFEGSITGPLDRPAIAGHAEAKNAKYEDRQIESFSGDLKLTSQSLALSNASAQYAGIPARGQGTVELEDWKVVPTSGILATVDLRNVAVPKLLTLAGHKEIDITGSFSTAAQITGTLENPLASADITVSGGSIYAQPFDSISGKLEVTDRNAQTLTGLFVSGPKRVNISARFVPAGAVFPDGALDFNLTSNTMPLREVALVRARQPDILGFGKFHSDGTIRLSHDAKREIQFDLLSLNADASANSLELGGRNLGDARLTAQTQNGIVQTHFESNAAQAAIRGDGTVRLSGDYPLDAKITFSKAGLNALTALAVTQDQARKINFDGELEGEADITGAIRKPEQIVATMNISRLELHALRDTDLGRTLPAFSLTNAAPIRLTASQTELKIEAARFKGPETNLDVSGSIAFKAQGALNLGIQGSMNLAIAKTLSPDLTSSGSIAINATMRGNLNTPDFSGRATIRNAEFHYSDFSNGLTAANGDIAFNGTRATLQSFQAESGGGKVDATGFAAWSGGAINFRVETHAQQIRVRYPEGVSSISDASLTLAGTPDRSEVSGLITVHRVSINPRADASSILASTVEPIQTPAVRTGIFSGMNLDVRIETAPDVALQTSVAQTIDADANLTLRGTVTNPALLGRINITQGELIFFGNKYSINQGTISFYNATRIEPILNVDFETKARGVEVTITISGPINKLNVTYRSDPPLQFSEIVALLATGRTPTDPTLAVRDSNGQSQSFQQLGASTLLGQAIANPVAGRLQRFFGVSRLKIDPQLTGVTGSPEARLTLEQQVTPEILFTYITDVSSTSTQLIRVEWAFNKHWSAILIREENGYVGLDFAYKKRFK